MTFLTDIAICLSIVCWPLTPVGMALLWTVAWLMARRQDRLEAVALPDVTLGDVAMADVALVEPAAAMDGDSGTTPTARPLQGRTPADLTTPSWTPARHAHAGR